MKIRTKKVFVYKSDENDIAITKAYSKEEAIYKFEKQYPRIIGDQVAEVEYNYFDVAILQTRKY